MNPARTFLGLIGLGIGVDKSRKRAQLLGVVEDNDARLRLVFWFRLGLDYGWRWMDKSWGMRVLQQRVMYMYRMYTTWGWIQVGFTFFVLQKTMMRDFASGPSFLKGAIIARNASHLSPGLASTCTTWDGAARCDGEVRCG